MIGATPGVRAPKPALGNDCRFLQAATATPSRPAIREVKSRVTNENKIVYFHRKRAFWGQKREVLKTGLQEVAGRGVAEPTRTLSTNQGGVKA